MRSCLSNSGHSRFSHPVSLTLANVLNSGHTVVVKTRKTVTVRTADELGRALGLSQADTAEMEFRSELTLALAEIIQAGRLTHAEIARLAGTSRTRVTGIANGNTHGVSIDVLIRVLAATGHRAEARVKKAAA